MQIISDFQTRVKELVHSGYFIKIEQYITKGFIIFRKKPDLFLLYTALFLLSLPFGGVFISFPFIAGFFIAAHRLDTEKNLVFEHFFDGFKFFLQLILLMLVQGIFVSLGFLFLIFPGIYLLVAYFFAPFFVIFGNMDFWQAMETSRKLVRKEWLGIFGFILVLGIINLLGVLAFGAGVLFTLPITYCAMYVAFRDIVGLKG